MNAVDLIESFSEFKEMKNIDRGTMMRIVEDVFRSTLKRKYGSDENVDVIVFSNVLLKVLYKFIFSLLNINFS